jgi:hypothetical protein
MKRLVFSLLFLFLASCSGDSVNSQLSSSIISSPEIMKPEDEQTNSNEETLVEDNSIIMADRVIVTNLTNIDESINKIFGSDFVKIKKYNPERLTLVNHIVFIYDDALLRSAPPGMFGVFKLEPLDLIVKEFKNKKYTFIHPSTTLHAPSVLNELSIESVSKISVQRLMVKSVVDELYPGITEHGNIGILTSAFKTNEQVPFLPNGTYKLFNDSKGFFEEKLDTRIILYGLSDDLGYPPALFNKKLNRGEIEGFVHTDGSVVILVRFSNDQLFEAYYMDERVLKIRNKLTQMEVYPYFARKSYNKPVGFIQQSQPYTGPISQLEPRLIDLNVCRLQEKNNSYGKAFPNYSQIAKTGEINIAILALDFPDMPGDPNLIKGYLSQVETLEKWSEFVSGGKMKYKVQFPDKWITAPKDGKFYSNLENRSTNQQYMGAPITEETQSVSASIQQILTAADNDIDWSVVDYLQIILPLEIDKYITFIYIGYMDNISTPKAGSVNFPLVGGVVKNLSPLSNDTTQRSIWDWVAHELLHFQGLIGHGPMNGSQFGIMMNQHAKSKALLSYESFLMGHFDEQQIACIDPEKLDDELVIKLESLDKTGGQPGIKSLMIPLSESEMIIVEHRTDGPFSELSPEFKGFTAYFIDVSKKEVRCDACETLKMEMANFWRYIRSSNEIMGCNSDTNNHIGQCGYPSLVQQPGYYLDFNGFRFEFFDDGILSVKRLFN